MVGKKHERKVLYSLRLDRRQLANLQQMAAERRVTVSALCRELLAAQAGSTTNVQPTTRAA